MTTQSTPEASEPSNPLRRAIRWLRSRKSWPLGAAFAVLFIGIALATAITPPPPGDYLSGPNINWWLLSAFFGLEALRRLLFDRQLIKTSPRGRRLRRAAWRIGGFLVMAGYVGTLTMPWHHFATATTVVLSIGVALMVGSLLAMLIEHRNVRR